MKNKREWRKSSRSVDDIECVEICDAEYLVRDSKDPNGHYLRFPNGRAIHALAQAIKSGHFN